LEPPTDTVDANTSFTVGGAAVAVVVVDVSDGSAVEL